MRLRRFAPRLVLPTLLLATLAAGCGDDAETTAAQGPAKAGPGPYGEIASNAAEAWPNAPELPSMSPTDVLTACAAWSACPVDPLAGSGFPERFELCIRDLVVPSAERAVPMTVFLTGVNERAEFFVACALAAETCDAMGACLTDRSSTIYCEEDGCRALYDYVVTCNGDVASLATGGAPIVRDCSRALSVCDPTSHTGCADRPFSQCDPALDPSDRCDGDIRLGCDGQGQVSYHDCARLGGTCGTTDTGAQDCIYPTTQDPPCEGVNLVCAGGTLSACVLGEIVSIPMPDTCP